ncbi:hypothetical protein [Comamonas sp. 26]|uniref:hypothetical protein n=1 Tax=Comamonas sp. 26 TaxID=2035201 RepID=UPI001E2C1050|nr:hypothetical protein [Comamonas sp. 26]
MGGLDVGGGGATSTMRVSITMDASAGLGGLSWGRPHKASAWATSTAPVTGNRILRG